MTKQWFWFHSLRTHNLASLCPDKGTATPGRSSYHESAVVCGWNQTTPARLIPAELLIHDTIAKLIYELRKTVDCCLVWTATRHPYGYKDIHVTYTHVCVSKTYITRGKHLHASRANPLLIRPAFSSSFPITVAAPNTLH